MIVIADTSPVNYLCQIDLLDLLPQLFKQVIVPEAVLGEMKHPRAPEKVRAIANRTPDWMVVSPRVPVDESLAYLGPGEAQVLSLALALRKPGVQVVLLIDDAEGRAEAAAMHFDHLGTFGVLHEAAIAKLVRFSEALNRLRQTNIHLPSESTLHELVKRLG
jgi:predicted nucleic acid-binding protein